MHRPLLDDSFPLPLDLPFTRHVANDAGITDKQLLLLVRDGLLRHPIRGVYVATQAPDDLSMRIAMLLLVVPPDCFVVDRTAAWLHGAVMALAPNDHLAPPAVSMFRHADHGRLRNAIARSGERTVLARDLMEVGGICVTTPLRTALDLGRLLHRDQALACLDALLRLGVFTREELLAELGRLKGQRGIRQLRVLAPLADGRAESPGESVLRLRWLDAGLPRPQLQIEIVEGGRTIYLLDIGLEELLFAVEYDGEDWHSERADREYDDDRRDWLSRRRGWLIKPFRSNDVHGRSDPEVALMAAYRQARASLGERTYIAMSAPRTLAPTRRWYEGN
jgi:hypothetical protein